METTLNFEPVVLVRPGIFLTPSIPKEVMAYLDQLAGDIQGMKWPQRFDTLLPMMLEKQRSMLEQDAPLMRIGQGHIAFVTCVLEQLCEKSINHPIAALFYGLSDHRQWRAAATIILYQWGNFKMPAYNSIARCCAVVLRDMAPELFGGK